MINDRYENLIPLLMIDVLFLAKEDLWKILNWKKANERLEAILAADDEDDDLN